MKVKIIVEKSDVLIYFVRFANYYDKPIPCKIVAYMMEYCEQINLLHIQRQEFLQEPMTETKGFNRFFDVWEAD